MSNTHLRKKVKKFILSKKYWWTLIILGIISRAATWLFPFDSDHWIFYYVGEHWFNGGTLYLTVWDHKSPLIFAINGSMSFLFGDNIVFHRIFLTLISVLTAWLFYLTSKRLLSHSGIRNVESSSRLAAVLFVFWSNLSQFTNSANNTENFGILFLILNLYSYLRFRDTTKIKWLFLSGTAISIMLFLKVNFALLALPMILDFIYVYRKDLRRFISYGIIWIAPTIVQLLFWANYFKSRGLLEDAIIASLSFNSQYLRAGWAGNLSGQIIFVTILLIALMFFGGFIFFGWKNISFKSNKIVLSGVLISSVLFSVILGTFYNHYYLIVIPYFCLLIAFYWRSVVNSKLLLILCLIGLVGSYGVSTRQLYNNYFGGVKKEANEMQIAANYIESKTDKNDKIIYHGYGATFYQLSDRNSGSRFISASHPLIDEREKFGYQLTEKHISDMENTKPLYVVVNLSTKNLYNQNEKLKDYLYTNYTLETLLEGYEILRRN